MPSAFCISNLTFIDSFCHEGYFVLIERGAIEQFLKDILLQKKSKENKINLLGYVFFF